MHTARWPDPQRGPAPAAGLAQDDERPITPAQVATRSRRTDGRAPRGRGTTKATRASAQAVANAPTRRRRVVEQLGMALVIGTRSDPDGGGDRERGDGASRLLGRQVAAGDGHRHRRRPRPTPWRPRRQRGARTSSRRRRAPSPVRPRRGEHDDVALVGPVGEPTEHGRHQGAGEQSRGEQPLRRAERDMVLGGDLGISGAPRLEMNAPSLRRRPGWARGCVRHPRPCDRPSLLAPIAVLSSLDVNE